MTILNVHVDAGRHRALVAGDSLQAYAHGPGLGPKFAALPHVLAGRGTVQFVPIAVEHVARAAPRDFDQLCEVLPGVCRAVAAEIVSRVGRLEDGGVDRAVVALFDPGSIDVLVTAEL